MFFTQMLAVPKIIAEMIEIIAIPNFCSFKAQPHERMAIPANILAPQTKSAVSNILNSVPAAANSSEASAPGSLGPAKAMF